MSEHGRDVVGHRNDIDFVLFFVFSSTCLLIVNRRRE